MAVRSSAKLTNKIGVTLVELLVAAGVLSIAIIAIFAVISKGRELQVTDNHRRQARAIIDSLMEVKYDDRDYASINNNTVTSTHSLGPGFTATITEQVVQSNKSFTIGSNINYIPVITILIRVRWNEADRPDSIQIQKEITGVRKKI